MRRRNNKAWREFAAIQGRNRRYHTSPKTQKDLKLEQYIRALKIVRSNLKVEVLGDKAAVEVS